MTVHTVRLEDQPGFRPRCQHVMEKPPRKKGGPFVPDHVRWRQRVGRTWTAECPNVSVSKNADGLWVCQAHGGEVGGRPSQG